MRRYIAFIILLLLTIDFAYSQTYTLSGTVLNEKSKKPIEFAVISIPDFELWTVADAKGNFSIKNVPEGKMLIVTTCLGYVKKSLSVNITKDPPPLKFYLLEDNLALGEVVVTAKRKADATTTYILDQTALDHQQVIDVSDVTSLLPGGKTVKSNLLTGGAQHFELRSGLGYELGNSSFGTAVEVDGVRLSNNASLAEKGVDTRNIATSNIDYIEVVNGVPSVEHGDLTNGMVKIHTRKGRSPLMVDVILQPNTKLYSLSKGIMLGASAGVLNTSVERAESVANIESPYTSYDRNTLSLLYTNTLNQSNDKPLNLTFGVTGNLGGYDSKQDPDRYGNDFTKSKDNTIRAHFALNWLANKSCLTNVEFSGSINYSDRLSQVNTYKSSSVGDRALHGQKEGYYLSDLYANNPDAEVVLVPPGSWYELRNDEDKPIVYNLKLKGNWAKKIGMLNSRFLLGADFSSSGNKGRGVYYGDLSLAPTWREYRLDKIPYTNNLAVYAQEQVDIPIQKTNLELTAGVRSDITMISGSEYGTVNSFAPRLNLKYDVPLGRKDFFREFTFRAGYGEAMKLPSFSMLYPRTSYTDSEVFSSTSNADKMAYYGYYIEPVTLAYNSNLKWQKDRLFEIGADATIGGVKVSLSFFNNKTINPYAESREYKPFSYKHTATNALGNSTIPTANREFSIDRETGVVTVKDITGAHPNEVLAYEERKTFKSISTYTNGSPITRRGLEWVVDFGKIPSLRTSFRLDGEYYYYKGLDENISASVPLQGADGNPSRYIGYYVGNSQGISNGSIGKELNTNLTVTTHIPEVRLIVSLRLEASLYNYNQPISEYKGKAYGYVFDSRDANYPSQTLTDIYARDRFVGVFPLYYATYDDPNTMIPFAEKYAWAKDNDQVLYAELLKLVRKTGYNYMFNEDKISAYFSGNIAITKEIGKYVSVTFQAKNFFNSLSRIKYSNTDTEGTVYNSGSSRVSVPRFYYGLSLKIKI